MTDLCGMENLPSHVSVVTPILGGELSLIRRERIVTLVYCEH